MAATVVCIAVYSLIFSLTYYSSLKEEKGKKLKTNEVKNLVPFYVALGAIFVVQLISTQFSIGYINDTKLFRLWTSWGEDYHIWEYYTTDRYVDYPPVYLTVLFIVGKIAAMLGIDSQSDLFLCFVRFVPILFDMICSIFIFNFSRKRLGDKAGMTLALLSAVNPINIFNSTVWGQIDSVVSLMIVGVLIFLYKRKYVAATTLFVASILTKPQMIIYAPVFGFTIFFDFIEAIKNKDGVGKMLKSIGFSLLAAVGVIVIVPLAATGGNYMLLIDKYKNALGLYQYATVCAANFYGAFGGNWVKNTETFFIFSYKVWGFLSIITMSCIIGIVMYKAKDRAKIFYMAAFTVSTIFMFAHGMHERYIHALFLMLIVIYIIKRDPKVLAVYLLFSMSNLVNCVLTLIKNHQDSFIYGDNPIFIFNSWINILIYIFMAYIFYIALFKNSDYIPVWSRIKNSWTSRKKQETVMLQETKSSFVKKDYLIMAVITLVYAVLAFWNLGSMSVPEKGWYPESAEESVVIDLGEERDIKRIYTHSGWIDRHVTERDINRNLALEISSDGENFTPISTTLALNKVFTWKATELDETARFIKFTPDDNRFYLNEIAFFGDSEAEKYIPTAVISENETAQFLIDEQDKVRYEYSWYDNTYFDEIYHPRTAYEYTQDLHPYENTHPPLGKIFISWGISLFGMTPFGWRFFGTLCGVLMVPLCYAFAKKLFKKTSWASIACVIFTFDFMHLSQTRLATIDSFTTFFVMGMYFFMYLYMKEDAYNHSKKSALWLLLSGIFFGLGAATKWQGIYAGFGLAILFFITYFKRWREYQGAQSLLNKGAKKQNADYERANLIGEKYKLYAIKTIIYGVVFFVVIPAIIYFISYIPTMNNEGQGIEYFFKNQETMFSYHSSIEGKHSYMSSWWTWLFDIRPLYAYGANRMFVPEGTAQGISTFGNPLVWMLTIPAVLGVIYLMLRRKGNEELKTLLIGFLSMLLPWALISRSSFIYHFFPCVIFVVFMIVYLMKTWYEMKPCTARAVAIGTYTTLVVVLFIAFYPVLTGMEIPESYAAALTWMPSWVLG